VDAKVRNLVLQQQQQDEVKSHHLMTLIDEDVSSITSYLLDYRKYYPLQSTLISNGFSEQELIDIGNLVNKQVSEMNGIQSEWEAEYKKVKDQQVKILSYHAEFSKTYETVVQTLSMAQGRINIIDFYITFYLHITNYYYLHYTVYTVLTVYRI
jgi:hypothetical protein